MNRDDRYTIVDNDVKGTGISLLFCREGAPVIEVVENYQTGEPGGILICAVPLAKAQDVLSFVEAFSREASGISKENGKQPQGRRDAVAMAAERALLSLIAKP